MSNIKLEKLKVPVGEQVLGRARASDVMDTENELFKISNDLHNSLKDLTVEQRRTVNKMVADFASKVKK